MHRYLKCSHASLFSATQVVIARVAVESGLWDSLILFPRQGRFVVVEDPIVMTMKRNLHFWLKPFTAILVLSILTWFLPVAPLDPWNLLSPKKIATMILALSIIQAVGSALTLYFGSRAGSILTGFLGGLVSSTATTATLARKTKHLGSSNGASEMLIYLSATAAMLLEGLALVFAGTSELQYRTTVIFIGPLVATVVMIFLQSRKIADHSHFLSGSKFEIASILKLAMFIVAILAVSKILQSIFGKNGLMIWTALASLFEIHGSIIANVQLYESTAINVNFLCNLLAISVLFSYLSKLFLVASLGSPLLRSHASRSTFVLFIVLAMSWASTWIWHS